MPDAGLGEAMAAGKCDFCGVEEYMPYVCKFCKGRFCAQHRLPESHNCAGLGTYRERVREGGRVFASDPLARPTPVRAQRVAPSLDAFWSKVDGKMTYILLGIIVGVFVLEYAVLVMAGEDAFVNAFVIDANLLRHPWTLVTNIFAHDPSNFNHIFFNALALLFFGVTVERLIGTRRYTYVFLLAGVVAGLAQVLLTNAIYGAECTGPGGCGALGASGALMGLMGTLVVLAPTLTVLVFFFIPAPLWALTILYVLYDVFFHLGASGVGGIAHLTGLAVGLGFGYYLRQRGLRAVVRPREPSMRSF